MYKYLVLGVLLSLQLGELLGMSILLNQRDSNTRELPLFVQLPDPKLMYGSTSHTAEENQQDILNSLARELNDFKKHSTQEGQVDLNSKLKNLVKGPIDSISEDSQKHTRSFNSLVNELNDVIKHSAQDNQVDSNSNLKNLAKGFADSISVPARDNPTELSSSVNIVSKQLSSEYLVTKGIGAHKLHLRQLPWNKARKVCIDEGGQLADIRSDSEEKIVLRMLVEDSVDTAWIGYHDMFEEGDWVSVLGEPLGTSGWDRWWKKRLPNPDNTDGEEDCAALMSDDGGMNDDKCSKKLAFVCKITALK